MSNQQAHVATLIDYISRTTSHFLYRLQEPGWIVAFIASATGKTRSLSFCIRAGILPDDVRALFAGFSPSLGHSKRMLKILRAKLYRQIRLHRINLGVLLQNSFESSVTGFLLRRYLQLAGQATEAL